MFNWTVFKNRLSSQLPERLFSNQNCLLFHFFVCSLGLGNAAAFLAHEVYGVLASQIYIPYNDWVFHYLTIRKPEELLTYACFLLICVIYFSIVAFLVLKHAEIFAKPFANALRHNWVVAFAYGLLLCVVMRYQQSHSIQTHIWIIVSAPWMLLTAVPIAAAFWEYRSDLEISTNSRLARYANVALLVLLLIQFTVMFLPFLRTRLRMMNEFLDLPEETWISNRLVENSEFINTHDLFGIRKYTPEQDKGNSPIPREGFSVSVPKTPLLADFLEEDENISIPDRNVKEDVSAESTSKEFTTPNPGQTQKQDEQSQINREIPPPLKSDISTTFSYDDNRHLLIINRAMTFEEKTRLEEIMPDKSGRSAIDDLFFSSNFVERKQQGKVYTAEEREFFKKNKFEFHWQILNRWVVHHHNFVLTPINEYALGKPLKQINMQYGLFNVLLMKYLLDKTGGLTYQNYFRIWYSFWPLYYFFFVMGCFFLLKDIRYVLAACLTTFGAIQFIDYKILFLGPGLNPIRHFCDVLIVVAFHFYAKTERRLFLISSLFLTLLAVLNNTQFGYFILGALFATMAIRHYSRHQRLGRFEIASAILTIFATVWISRASSMGTDYMLHYYLAGFASFPISDSVIIGVLLLFTIGTLMLVWKYDPKNPLQDTAIFLAFYSDAALIYWIWGATYNHLLNLAPILMISLMIYIKWAVERFALKPSSQSIGSVLVFSSLIFLYIPSLAIYYHSRSSYNRIFETHRTYQWNLDRAKFESTVNPQYFSDAVSLIRKYSPDTNGIYIISKYDNFVPFLSGKYSSMPFFDVPWFLVSSKEIDLCIQAIKQRAPKYLFVDTDIDRNLNDEIIGEHDPLLNYLHDESILRVARLNEVKKIYRAVKNDYKPVEKSALLMVLERKGTPL